MRTPRRPLWIALACLFLAATLFSVAGCGSSSAPAAATAGTGGAAATQPAAESATVDGATLSVTKVIRSGGDDSTRSKRGHIWLVLKLQIENKGSQSVAVNIPDFTLVTSKGDAAQAQLPRFVAGPLASASLAAGQTAEGKIAFDIADSEKQVTLKWKPAGGTGEASLSVAAQ